MAHTSSKFFAMNLVHLSGELGTGDALTVDLKNDVVRPALVLHEGEALPPPEVKPPSPSAVAKVEAPKPAAIVKAEAPKPAEPNPAATAFGGLVVVALLGLLGKFAPPEFLQHSTVFVLACFVGWQVVWSVTPALHTPLMSVTNAISGIIVVGGMLQVGSGLDVASILGAIAVLVATVNIAGGFLVTQRMLKMFRRDAPAAKSSGGHR
jgi:NAD(P) transhydrogenase subunit alpha